MLNLKITKILVLIYFIFLSYGYVIAGEKNLACDVNVIWVGNGNTYNKKRIIKLKIGKESIQLEGQILKYTFDKYLDNKQIIIDYMDSYLLVPTKQGSSDIEKQNGKGNESATTAEGQTSEEKPDKA